MATMRKEAKIEKKVKGKAYINGYYSGECDHGYSGYEHAGFGVMKYFTSDRYELLDSNFNRPNGAPLQGYGLEVETTCGTIYNSGSTRGDDVLAEVIDKVIFSHFPANLWKFQHDGSLNGTSVECITQVMTKKFIRNHYRDFKLMYDRYFPALGIVCDGSCGMHTNISNACFGKTKTAQDEAIRKLFYIVNHYYTLCCNLFNRSLSCTAYCHKMPCDLTYAKNLNLNGFSSNHGVCFNLGHYGEGRIELRLVGPQKTYNGFRNTMEAVFFLVERVQKLKWDDIDDPVKVFEGCNNYVYSRLMNCCFGELTNEQLQEIKRKSIYENLEIG